jgi:hypothetical protein
MTQKRFTVDSMEMFDQLNIPRTDSDGKTLTAWERAQELRRRYLLLQEISGMKDADIKNMMRIYQNEDSTTYVTFVPTQARYVLFVDRKAMFACPYPLK